VKRRRIYFFHADVTRNDSIEEYIVDSKAECGQLNLAHVAKNKNKVKRRN